MTSIVSSPPAGPVGRARGSRHDDPGGRRRLAVARISHGGDGDGEVTPSGSLPNFGADKHPRRSRGLSKVADATVPAGGSCAHRKSACWRRIAQLQPTLAHEDWSLEFIKISISRVTQSTELGTDFWDRSRVSPLTFHSAGRSDLHTLIYPPPPDAALRSAPFAASHFTRPVLPTSTH